MFNSLFNRKPVREMYGDGMTEWPREAMFDTLVPPVTKRAIDVSKWETNAWDYNYSPASWANAVNQSIEIIIPKVTQGILVDPSAWYWADARKGGFSMGGYHFWNATDGVSAANVYNITRRAYDFTDLPPIIDFEPTKVCSPTIPANLKVFFDAVEQGTGQAAILYSSVSYLAYHFPKGAPDWLKSKKLWLASWPYYDGSGDRWSLSNYSYAIPSIPGGWTYNQLIGWQFTDKITIPGYAGGVDGNFWYPNGFAS